MSADSDKRDDLARLGEAARRAGLSVRQLEYYMLVGLVEPTSRSGGRQRLFDARTIMRARMIRLLNESGYSLRDIRDIFIEQRGVE